MVSVSNPVVLVHSSSSSPSPSRRPFYPPSPSPCREVAWESVGREVRRFGAEVRLRRIALGLRLIDLAPRAHISPTYLGKIENGRGGADPSLGVAISIARGLGTDVQDLLGGFKGLTPIGLEAGRICDALPAQMQSAVMDLLRAAHRSADGAAAVE